MMWWNANLVFIFKRKQLILISIGALHVFYNYPIFPISLFCFVLLTHTFYGATHLCLAKRDGWMMVKICNHPTNFIDVCVLVRSVLTFSMHHTLIVSDSWFGFSIEEFINLRLDASTFSCAMSIFYFCRTTLKFNCRTEETLWVQPTSLYLQMTHTKAVQTRQTMTTLKAIIKTIYI